MHEVINKNYFEGPQVCRLVLPSHFDFSWKCGLNLVINEQFVDKFDTPKNSKLAKISSLKFKFKKPYLLTPDRL